MVWLAAGAMALKAYGNYKKGKAKRKAAKARMKMLQEGLNQYKAGSIDALGNKLSANKQGVWDYNLNNSGKAARNAANNANYKLGTTADKTSAELSRDALMSNHLANTMTARANQAAAMRSGARTNSNLKNIANSFSQAGSQRLRDNYAQGIMAGKNANNYNAQMRQNLAQAATLANQPIQNIQGNLQNMVNNLNKPVMSQYNTMAGAAANPYMHGMDKGNMYEGIGSGITAYQQTQQQQMNFDALLKALMSSGGGA